LTQGLARDGEAYVSSFWIQTEGEGLLDLTARVPDGDWEVPGREAAPVRESIDGVYNQDVVLALGEEAHTYQLAIGAVKPGPHTLKVERLAAFSAAALTQVDVTQGTVTVVPPESGDYDTIATAPILVSRPTAHKTDTLLVMYSERHTEPDGRSWLRYTPVWSNEDGGTATRALMARWGRTVDIDWAYTRYLTPQNTLDSETYQGWIHITRKFKGRHEGKHPILQVASENNIYSDDVDGPLRFRPAPLLTLDADQTSREDILDRAPWTYELMVKELFRERKAARDGREPVPMRDGAIGDPRRFLFVEFQQESDGRGVAVAVKLKSMPDVFVSNRNDTGLQAERDGWCRVAVELPRAVTYDDLERVELFGLGHGKATVKAVRKVLVLDSSYLPVYFPITWQGSGRLTRNEDRVTIMGLGSVPPADRPQ
jgi:hypothetical protein